MISILNANALHIPLRDRSVQCVVTSPPYWGLRDYGTPPLVWGGDPLCDHDWIANRYYTGQTASVSSSDAFIDAGEANAERLKKGRWRENNTCSKCDAWLGNLGLEPTPEMFVDHLVMVFREVKRVLRDDGTLWMNLGDSYATAQKGGDKASPGDKSYTNKGGLAIPYRQINHGLKPKDLVGIPWMVAFALRADGWYLRSDIIWAKPNPMPESVTDRPTKSHEYLFLLTKSPRYFYDAEAIKEPATEKNWTSRYDRAEEGQKSLPTEKINGIRVRHPAGWKSGNGSHGSIHEDGRDEIDGSKRNRRTVWNIATSPYPGAHFATFPPALVEPCILSGTSERGCCPECGAPWERIVEAKRENYQTREDRQVATGGAMSGGVGKNFTDTTWETTGWQPTCDHEAEPIPCTVLDPFAGTATVGKVCGQHRRSFVGLELKFDYIGLANKRTSELQPAMFLG
jgi:DNA modification methylase